MILMHLSDLHLGKLLNGFSLIEDQEYILSKIVKIAETKKVDAVCIAGDVYDKSVASAEAVVVFDRFLTELSKVVENIFVISGNHDSAERLSFGSALMKKSGVHISPVFVNELNPITLTDEFGEVDFYLLPFIKPVHVRRFLPEEEREAVVTYTDAIKKALSGTPADKEKRNVLLTHQFVTGAGKTGSEEINVGGTDNVDVSVFDGFDYVALGHIHGAQKCGRETVRYSGTPLKYSLSEVNDEKTVTIVTLREKGKVDVELVPLKPRRELRQIEGTYEAITSKSFYDGTTFRDDYVYFVLKDEQEIPELMGKLRAIYKNVLGVRYDNKRSRENRQIEISEAQLKKTEIDLLSDLYEMQNNVEMNTEQYECVRALFEKLKEEN